MSHLINYEKFTCPKWKWNRKISTKHDMWSLWYVSLFLSETEELMALFKYYSNKPIKNYPFLLLVLKYYVNYVYAYRNIYLKLHS